MKRVMFSGMVAALLAAAAFSMSDAQGSEQRGPRPDGRPGFGGRGPGMIARFGDLTDDQRKQVQAILDEERASRQNPPAVVALHRQLESEILADAPDDQKIDALRQQLAQAQGDELVRQIAIQRKIAQILTPEQRSKARERLAQAPRGRGAH